MTIWSWMYSLMDPVPAFLIAIILVGLLVARLGLHPFLGLLTSTLVYGLLTGMGPEVIGHVTTGLARFFSALAIIIFSGSVIAEYLRRSRSVDRIVADLLGPGWPKKGPDGFGSFRLPGIVAGDVLHNLLSDPGARGKRDGKADR